MLPWKAINITCSKYVFVASRIFLRPILLPSGSIAFSHMSQTAGFLEKKLLNIKCVFWFSLQLLSETFLILRRNERDMVKNECWFHVNTFHPCQFLMKIEFPRQILEKFSNIEFNEHPCSEVAEFFRTDRRTDRRDGANSRISQFRQHADKIQPFFFQNWHRPFWNCPTPYMSSCRAAVVTSNVNQSFRILTVRRGRSQAQH
jgi:hypothetical protein